MITILTWNIQNGKGIDDKISLNRIAESILNICDPDIICLQEVSINSQLVDGSRPDQVKELSNIFSDYLPSYGPAYNIKGKDSNDREQYGNLILSRLPVLSSFNHMLPQTVDSSFRQMPRQLSEITVQTALYPLRVMTTHLEYHSELQRCEQVKRIKSINKEINDLALMPPEQIINSPYREFERASRALICGDFNFVPNSIEYDLMIGEKDSSESLVDAWRYLNPNSIHRPTCGIFDADQWPQGPHCRDYGFVSSNIAENLQNIVVNEKIDASDHQPVILTLS